MFHSNTEKLTKTFFHISLDLYLDHSIIIVSLDSDIKRLASSTAFIQWPLIFTPRWNQAPPRRKKLASKASRARTGEGKELSTFFPHFPPNFPHYWEEPGPRLLSFQRKSKGTHDAGPAMYSHLSWIVRIKRFPGTFSSIPKWSWCPCRVWRRNTPALALYTIGDVSGLKMFPDLLHLKYLDSKANIR